MRTQFYESDRRLTREQMNLLIQQDGARVNEVGIRRDSSRWIYELVGKLDFSDIEKVGLVPSDFVMFT